MKRKFLVYLSLFLVVSFVAGEYLYLMAPEIVDKASRKAIKVVTKVMNNEGIKFERLDYNWVLVKGVSGISWNDVNISINVNKGSAEEDKKFFYMYVKEAEFSVQNLLAETFLINIRDISVIRGKGLNAFANWLGEYEIPLEDNNFKILFRLDIFNPSNAILQLEQYYFNFVRFMKDSRGYMPMSSSISTSFMINDEPFKVRLEIVFNKQEGEYGMQLNINDLRSISAIMPNPMNELELGIISKNPDKASTLFGIWRRSIDEWKKTEKTRPELAHAYRHVFWSYLLTNAYGQDFARMVTDAHESNEGSELDHEMDQKNNELGREYAARGYQEYELLDKLSKDPNAVRSEKEIGLARQLITMMKGQ
ncbi:MAG: hypothetical protein HQL30_06380 [Candidatus Omnitrophica bacterium]|nr:hypothetical protein [Candidatus Omnitrophota bacterium]